MRRLAILLAAAGFITSACGGPAPATVTFIHFNDVYEISPIEAGRVGGLARVATRISEMRRDKSPLLVTLGGDYLSPSALGTARVNGEPIGGEQMVDVLNATGLQFAALGNHEFDLPEEAFRARLQQSAFRIIATNVTDDSGTPFENTEPHAVIELQVAGYPRRVGLLGLTIASNRRAWVRYDDPIAAARRAITAMGRVDAIVALTHQSLLEDEALVNAVPAISLVLGGHEHENWVLRRGVHLTPIVKADANVRSIAVVRMTFSDGDGRPEVDADFDAITDAIAADSTVDAKVGEWTRLAYDAFRRDGFEPDRVVAALTETLDGRESTVRNFEGALTALLTEAFARATAPVDVALMNGGSIRIDDELLPGRMREYDVIRILPFGGSLMTASMAGSLLARVLDVGQQNRGTGGFLHAWGADRRQGRWHVDGRPINPATKYRVVLTDWLLSGREVNLAFLTAAHPLISNVETHGDIRQAVIAELQRRFPASVE